ncbi:MAG: hypothetical protein GY793_07830 [Proteobacteria bacterium]|nr:hypothetical protein [Pseudomonadota bacterium]
MLHNRVALLLYGTPHLFATSYPLIKSSVHDSMARIGVKVDSFASFFGEDLHKDDERTHLWHDLKSGEFEVERLKLYLKDLNYFKSVCVEKNVRRWSMADRVDLYNTQSMQYMFESLYRAMQLRERYERANRVNYDYVIVMRTDCRPTRKINVYQITEGVVDKGGVFVISGDDFLTLTRKILSFSNALEPWQETDATFFARPLTLLGIINNIKGIVEKINQDMKTVSLH